MIGSESSCQFENCAGAAAVIAANLAGSVASSRHPARDSRSPVSKIRPFAPSMITSAAAPQTELATTGVYTAPASLSDAETVQVIAQSVANPAQSGRVPITLRPVSYTHLDVYKRQVERFEKNCRITVSISLLQRSVSAEIEAEWVAGI